MKANNIDNQYTELSENVISQIEMLSEDGNVLFDQKSYKEAISVWKSALTLIPSPQNVYSETLWLETSIGDAFFMLGNYTKAKEHLVNAKGNITELAYSNPFIMLRLGQVYFEENDTESAKEFLLRAYMLEGKDIFKREKAAYFKFLERTVLSVE